MRRAGYQEIRDEAIFQWDGSVDGQRICSSMEDVTLHKHEQARLHILTSVIAGEMESARRRR